MSKIDCRVKIVKLTSVLLPFVYFLNMLAVFPRIYTGVIVAAGTRRIEKYAFRTIPADSDFSLWSLLKSRMMSRNTPRPATFFSF
jgi:hypothetical protein